MNALLKPLQDGGPVVWLILALSVLLYTCAFSLVIHLFRATRRLARADGAQPRSPHSLRLEQEELQETFQRQRAMIAAMIAAAPLMGLLGTVTGMIDTFSHLAARVGSTAMDGLASGISEALVATEAGLAVAIPGVMLLYVAHRQLEKATQEIARLEQRSLAVLS